MKKIVFIGISILALLIGIFFMRLVLMPKDGASAAKGLKDAELAPCGESPNCVSSFDQRSDFYIEPIPYANHLTDAKLGLGVWFQDRGDVRVLETTENYMHAVFEIPFFGWKDDVELYFKEAEKRIYVRSASRVGYSDLGVNRNRVEEIRSFIQSKF